MFLAIVKNTKLSHFIRFNCMQVKQIQKPFFKRMGFLGGDVGHRCYAVQYFAHVLPCRNQMESIAVRFRHVLVDDLHDHRALLRLFHAQVSLHFLTWFIFVAEDGTQTFLLFLKRFIFKWSCRNTPNGGLLYSNTL